MPDYIEFLFTHSEYSHSTFEVVKFTGDEAISTLYDFDIEIATTSNDIDDEAMLNGTSKFVIKLGNEIRVWQGVIADIQAIRHVDGLTFYRVKLVPVFWNLSLYVSNEIFLDQTLIETVREVLTTSGFIDNEYDFKLSEDYENWDFRCQYEESNLNFFSRILERDGLYYYFEQSDGAEKLVITDSHLFDQKLNVKELMYQPVSGMEVNQLSQSIQSFVGKRERMPKSLTLRDYNDARPSVDISATVEVDGNGVGEVNVFGQNIRTIEEGKRLATYRAQEIRSEKVQFYGESTAFSLQPGYVFNLIQHFKSAYNTSYLIVSVRHEGINPRFGVNDQKDYVAPYSNQFTVIPAIEQFRPRRVAKKPEIYGNMNAIVDAEGDGKYAELDAQGRYKVMLPFDRQQRQEGKASHWIRMSQPFGGEDEGMHFPLRKGARVLLSFIDGDPDRPFITGSLPTDSQPSIVSSDNQTNSMIKTTSGNKIEIEDQEGSNRIKLETGDRKSYVHVGAPNHDGDGIVMLTKGLGRFEFLKGFTSTEIVGEDGLSEFESTADVVDPISDIVDKVAFAEKNWKSNAEQIQDEFNDNFNSVTVDDPDDSSKTITEISNATIVTSNFSDLSLSDVDQPLQVAVLEYMKEAVATIDVNTSKEISFVDINTVAATSDLPAAPEKLSDYNGSFKISGSNYTFQSSAASPQSVYNKVLGKVIELLNEHVNAMFPRLILRHELPNLYLAYIQRLADHYDAELKLKKAEKKNRGVKKASDNLKDAKTAVATAKSTWKTAFTALKADLIDSVDSCGAASNLLSAFFDEFSHTSLNDLNPVIVTQLYFAQQLGGPCYKTIQQINADTQIFQIQFSGAISIPSSVMDDAQASSLVDDGDEVLATVYVNNNMDLAAWSTKSAEFILNPALRIVNQRLRVLNRILDMADPTKQGVNADLFAENEDDSLTLRDEFDEMAVFRFPALDKDGRRETPSGNGFISPSGFLTRDAEMSGNYLLDRKLGKFYRWHHGSILDFGRNSNLYDFGPSYTQYQSKDWLGSLPSDDEALYRRWNYEVKIAAIADGEVSICRALNIDFDAANPETQSRKLLDEFGDKIKNTWKSTLSDDDSTQYTTLPQWVYLLAVKDLAIDDEVRRAYVEPNREPWVRDASSGAATMNGVTIDRNDAVVDQVIGDYYGYKYGMVREIWVGDFDEEYYGDYREIRAGDTVDSHDGNVSSTHYGNETVEQHGDSTETKHGGTHTSEFKVKSDQGDASLEKQPTVVTRYSTDVIDIVKDGSNSTIEKKRLECESKGFKETRYHPDTGGINNISHQFDGGLVNFETQFATQFNMNTTFAPLSTTINNGPAMGIELNLLRFSLIYNSPLWTGVEAGPGPKLQVNFPGFNNEYELTKVKTKVTDVDAAAVAVNNESVAVGNKTIEIKSSALAILMGFTLNG